MKLDPCGLTSTETTFTLADACVCTCTKVSLPDGRAVLKSPLVLIKQWVYLWEFHFRFLTEAAGLMIDEFEANVHLNYLIPEHLPIFGVKAKAYYHGMPKQCGSCFELGHIKSECQSDPKSFFEYVNFLAAEGIPAEHLGVWTERAPLRSRARGARGPRGQRGRGVLIGGRGRGRGAQRGIQRGVRGGARGRGRGRGNRGRGF